MMEKIEYDTNDLTEFAIKKLEEYEKTKIFPEILNSEIETKKIYDPSPTINFFNEKNTKLCGWQSIRYVENGDLFLVPMQSGRSAIFEIFNVKYKLDPSDMFFADVIPIGYLKEEV